MTPEERREVQKALVVTAEIYGRVLSAGAVSLMADALMDLDGRSVLAAIRQYVASTNSKTFPLPGQIRDLVKPTVRTEDQVNIAIGRIRQALAKFGSYDPEGAKAFVGELGWAIVVRDGGWVNMCKLETSEMPIVTSQWRKIGESVMRAGLAGTLEEPPMIAAPRKESDNKGMAAIGATLPKLTKKEKND